jgi:site-specific DNA-methyltransferase (adenine-specific)
MGHYDEQREQMHNDNKPRLMLGECLERMKEIPSGSVDMILTDPPYGTTACKWDSIIPLEPMWEQLKRVIKPNGAIVLTASQPFTTTLISSNMKMFKYCWVWRKNKITGHMQAKTKPMNSYEDIVVFGEFSLAAQYFNGTYNPQGAVFSDVKSMYSNKERDDSIYGDRRKGTGKKGSNYPKNIIKINSDTKTVHPTQKPVALMEYLIKTYTNEGEAVLDFTMGSGSTGVAAKNLNRDFIGIELDEDYFKIAKERINNS